MLEIGSSILRRSLSNEISIAFSLSVGNLVAFSDFLDPHSSLSATPASLQWVAPPENVVKINSDATLFQDKGDIGIGVIARDSIGRCLAWKASRFHRRLAAEAWAVRIAIELAAQYGWNRIILEGDCATLLTKLKFADCSSPVSGPIVHDVLMLSSSFLSCS
ncbi:UNVERIFIED_CONTAM: hypothetical protein Slati_2674400 [Sesamum latifolium]|uniref:RNase H type-1 domain-containing protein n=1 Tax=Sesamum latifolium TaxID=2727402 RepID=A0AAW2VWW7_9LAMI